MSNHDPRMGARMNSFPPASDEKPAPPRQVTGLMVLGFMLAFFAIIVGVNAFMAHAALTTFGGVETASSYQAGQTFEREVVLAELQDARHWQVDAKLTRTADGTTRLDITAQDGSGAPVSDVAANAQFARPTDRRLDHTVAVRQTESGHFVGDAELAAGQWDLLIELSRQGERVFRSKNRVILK